MDLDWGDDEDEDVLINVHLTSDDDVTLDDFANARSGSARIKKGVVNASSPSSLLHRNTSDGKADLSWFEKDEEDFEFELDEAQEEREGEEEDEDQKEKVAVRPRRGRRQQVKRRVEEGGRIYPVDLWYILSNYVHPESVGRFACLCRDTYQVTCTIGFWRQLYFRYYDKKVKLPDELHPTVLERVHGLKARVVRALFYMYPPLSERCHPTTPFSGEPHCLEGQRCLLAWHQPVKNHWNFCFKFKSASAGPSHTRSSAGRPMDLINDYNDFNYNPDFGCCILQVTCSNFSAIPQVMGLLLCKVYMTLSQGFRHHRLRLVFDTRLHTNQAAVPPDNTVLLDPVTNTEILYWWDPKYPFVI